MILGRITSSAFVVTHSNPVYRKMPRMSACTGKLLAPGMA
jgi:hypothetical protein